MSFSPQNPPETPPPAPQPPPIGPGIFPEPGPAAQVCSSNRCSRGHTWAPTLALTRCPGCGGHVLAIKMEQCPQCNEPCTEFALRADHLSPQMQVAPVCRGAATLAEAVTIHLRHEHAEQEEQRAPAARVAQKLEPPYGN
jgi:hypothetical protein